MALSNKQEVWRETLWDLLTHWCLPDVNFLLRCVFTQQVKTWPLLSFTQPSLVSQKPTELKTKANGHCRPGQTYSSVLRRVLVEETITPACIHSANVLVGTTLWSTFQISHLCCRDKWLVEFTGPSGACFLHLFWAIYKLEIVQVVLLRCRPPWQRSSDTSTTQGALSSSLACLSPTVAACFPN